jgi:hypothetical protein
MPSHTLGSAMGQSAPPSFRGRHGRTCFDTRRGGQLLAPRQAVAAIGGAISAGRLTPARCPPSISNLRSMPPTVAMETDSMAGHIGFELWCAERKFISLNMRQYSDFPEPPQTVPSSRENNFLCEAGLLVAGTHPREAARPVFQVHHIGVRILSRDSNRCEHPNSSASGFSTGGELRTIQEGSRCGQMSKRIADFPLDIPGKQSVSGGQWRPILIASNVLSPPAPVGLRGVAVVRRAGAPRPREDQI